jgi:hypothetical protein
MDRGAQAGVEYLMTYGWALVLIATIVAALVFFLAEPTGMVFTSSQPTKLMVETGSLNDDKVAVVAHNLTGGYIRVVSVTLDGTVFADKANDPEYEISKLNGVEISTINRINPIEIIGGGALHFTDITYKGGKMGFITIEYSSFEDPELILIANIKGEMAQPSQ